MYIYILTNLIVIIILQYVCVSSYHVVHFKLTQYYISIISQLARTKGRSYWEPAFTFLGFLREFEF